MAVAGHIESDGEKGDLYRQMIDSGRKTDAEWISLIRAVGRMEEDWQQKRSADADRTKDASNEIVKAEYKTAARTIKDDADYGKACER